MIDKQEFKKLVIEYGIAVRQHEKTGSVDWEECSRSILGEILNTYASPPVQAMSITSPEAPGDRPMKLRAEVQEDENDSRYRAIKFIFGSGIVLGWLVMIAPEIAEEIAYRINHFERGGK